MRDEAQVERLFDRTVGELGVPYILVNNAGVNFTGTHVAEMPTAEWERTLRTNLYGPFFCCRRFIRERRGAGGAGKILNITSVHEDAPLPGAAAYDASKGGLRNLTRTLALELAADRINVVNIAPGMILTPMNPEELADPQKLAEAERRIPWGRAGRPDDVARVAAFLASAAADYITGTTVFVDGGLMMRQAQ